MLFFSQPLSHDRLGDFLKGELSNEWDSFRAAVAFVKRSGTRHIFNELASFSKSSSVEITIGIDHLGTSAEGLNDLLRAVKPNGKIMILHNRLPFTFHPKVFMFSSDTRALAVVGSGNLTEGGLFTNYEAGVRLDLDLTDSSHASIFEAINLTLEGWADTSSGTTLELDEALLKRLTALGLVPPEALAKKANEAVDAPREASAQGGETEEAKSTSPFAAVAVLKAPAIAAIEVAQDGEENQPATGKVAPQKAVTVPKASAAAETEVAQGSEAKHAAVATMSAQAAASSVLTGFVMTLQTTDVGVGQTTTGTSRRSPEIFIPLGARDLNPDFWGWPTEFVPDSSWAGSIDNNGFGKMDRTNVSVRLGGNNTTINMWYNPDKRDLRLRSEALRSSGAVGDILRIEKVSGVGYDYYVEIVPTGTTQHPVYLAKCDHSVRPPSKKSYGYY